MGGRRGAGGPGATVRHTVRVPPFAHPRDQWRPGDSWLRCAIGLFLVCVLAAALHVARLPRVAWDTMYAEDGWLFIHDAATGWTWWTEPYAGYLHVLPRAVATAVTTLLPVDAWAWGMTIGAAGIVGLVSATAFAAARTVDSSLPVAIFAAAVPVLVPVAAIESLANVGNSHSFALYGALAAVLAAPRTRLASWAFGLMALLFALTEVQTGLLIPIAWGWLLATRDRWRVLTVASLTTGVALQFIALLAIGRGSGGDRPTAVEVVRGWLFDGVVGSFLARVGPVRTIVETCSWWALACVAISWVLLVIVTLRNRPATMVLSLSLVLASFGSWAASHWINAFAAVNFDVGPYKMVRWGTASALLFLASMVVVATSLERDVPRARTWVRLVLVGVVLVQLLSFQLPTSRTGVHWKPEVAEARSTCAMSAKEVRIPVLPDGAVDLPCDRIE